MLTLFELVLVCNVEMRVNTVVQFFSNVALRKYK